MNKSSSLRQPSRPLVTDSSLSSSVAAPPLGGGLITGPLFPRWPLVSWGGGGEEVQALCTLLLAGGFLPSPSFAQGLLIL